MERTKTVNTFDNLARFEEEFNDRTLHHPISKRRVLSEIHQNSQQYVSISVTKYENGESYYGLHTENKREGLGKYYNKEGQLTYCGEFHKDRREGFGKLFDSNDQVRYEGLWKNNKGHGQGKTYSSDGHSMYEGEFVDGKKQGVGKAFNLFKNFYPCQQSPKKGEVAKESFMEYFGEFENNQRLGNGKNYYPNGVVSREQVRTEKRNLKPFKINKNRYGEIIGYD
jgi:antitoxin component YwqK of YwqJK toxin-antitoxin module